MGLRIVYLVSRCVRWEPHSESADHFALWRHEGAADEGRFVSPLRGSTVFQRHGWRGSVGWRPRLPLCQRYALQIGGVCEEGVGGLVRLVSRCVRWEPHSESADHFALCPHGGGMGLIRLLAMLGRGAVESSHDLFSFFGKGSFCSLAT